MVVHECEPDSADVDDRTQQLGDAHARARRGAGVDATQRKQPVSSVDDGHVELLLTRTADERRRQGDRARPDDRIVHRDRGERNAEPPAADGVLWNRGVHLN